MSIISDMSNICAALWAYNERVSSSQFGWNNQNLDRAKYQNWFHADSHVVNQNQLHSLQLFYYSSPSQMVFRGFDGVVCAKKNEVPRLLFYCLCAYSLRLNRLQDVTCWIRYHISYEKQSSDKWMNGWIIKGGDTKLRPAQRQNPMATSADANSFRYSFQMKMDWAKLWKFNWFSYPITSIVITSQSEMPSIN